MKKNGIMREDREYPSLIKWIRIMKLICLLLTFALVQISAEVHSQGKKLTLSLKDAPLAVVFDVIEKTSDFNFFYDNSALDFSRKVTLDVEDSNIEAVLDILFMDSDISYEIIERSIILKSKKNGIAEEGLLARQRTVSGTVTDESGQPIPGVTVLIKGTQVGTTSDIDGNFTIDVPLDAKVLLFTFVGMKPLEITIGDKTYLNIVMEEQSVGLEEVVVVGYGVQDKASVVGAISTTTSKELERSGGVNNLGMALTGKLAGVTTIQTSGQPGMNDPIIYIRGQGTWNGGQPYILVDGVERKMNDVAMSEVDNISVLKDASATAVYGVKGANGVILITTKRGKKGKPQLNISANSTLRYPSRLVDKLDAYDTYLVKNYAIEREVSLMEGMWADYTPLAIVERYRNQQNLKYPEAYPNVDWQEETIKDFTMDHQVNMNVSGGNDFAKYFSSLSYNTVGDLMKIRDNERGYDPGFEYDRFNLRTNLDLNLTKTTQLKINLAGVFSMTKSLPPYYIMDFALNGQYAAAPNAFLPRYEDGRWGGPQGAWNSAAYMSTTGYAQTNSTELISDLAITQKLDFITYGLSASANLSFDNRFNSSSSLLDGYDHVWPTKYYDRDIEDMPAGGDPNDYIFKEPVIGKNQFSYVREPWRLIDETGVLSALRRRLYYQGQLNYARTFGSHDITATGVFTREELATGSEFPRYREDWIFRATYSFDRRYFAEFNGAYNGSEKFGSDYRFAFFPSGAVGWTISNEKFMEGTNSWLDKLKLRYSYGKIGDDGGLSQRWLYETQWLQVAGSAMLSEFIERSPYNLYREGTVGNPDIHWETAKKSNLGLEIAVLRNTISANLEYFNEDRTGILLLGSSRIVPPYYGANPPTGNVGRVIKEGYEIELEFNKRLQGWHLWAATSMTHAVDEIMEKEEPTLKDPHLLAKGFQIEQTKAYISQGYIQTWDDIYASTRYASLDGEKLPGNYYITDFNSDGVIDAKDVAPYGYSTRPQNNYNLSLGADYKGFSVMLQFYGVNNVTRMVPMNTFLNNTDIAYEHTLDHWSKDNPNGSSFVPRWKTHGQNNAEYFLFDGSYLRLKTAELAYTFEGKNIKLAGISSLKLYLNGHNLFFWSDLPDDRELGSDRFGAYPASSRINLGVDIKF
jgi:TonB-linked SusC/RagA family outer membrane protein